MAKHNLRLPAIEFKQGPGRTLYSFAVDGKQLASFAAVSRLRRADGQGLTGYQRPEVLSHIAGIRSYLESENPMVPNAIVVAFDDRVRFEAAKSKDSTPYSTSGTIVIPVDDEHEEAEKPGWIVDGQQRAAAIREARIDAFPMSVTAFVANNETEQREQFILVNSTKPLPKGLIYELLPQTESRLPAHLQRRRFPALLLERLNFDVDSRLAGLVNTPTTPDGVIKDNSLLKMIENSLSDGVLYRYRDSNHGNGNVEAILGVLKAFWAAVAEVFEGAWGLKPRRSRLMHGAGIQGLGFLMDAISERYRTESSSVPTTEQFTADLRPLTEVCRWTDGYWEFGPGAQRKWNELQNTSKDVQLLANYLLVQYKALVWNRRELATR